MSLLTALISRVSLFEALQYRDYRIFWSGQVVSVMGFQMLIVTIGWLMYDITGSSLQLGLVGLSMAVPAIVLNLFGGVVADKVDPRRLIMIVQSLNAVAVGIMATLVLMGLVQPWHIMANAFIMGALGAFDQPSRQAIFPHLIDRRVMMNAVALNSMVWQGNRIVGPAIAGVLIAWVGAPLTLYLATAGFLVFVMFLSAVRMPRIPRSRSAAFFRDLLDGLSFVRKHHIFAFLLGMTFFNSFFGLSYVFLLPIFQKDILGVGPSGLGFLHAMSGIGAVTGTLIVASLRDFRNKGVVLVGGAIAFGTLLILFGYSNWFPVSLALVALAGMSTATYMILTQSTLQLLVPDQLRGRIMGLWGMTFNIMPLGGFYAGILASYIGAPSAVAIGGVAVIAFAVFGAARDRQVRRLDIPSLQSTIKGA